jgi:hypothetical protein
MMEFLRNIARRRCFRSYAEAFFAASEKWWRVKDPAERDKLELYHALAWLRTQRKQISCMRDQVARRPAPR